MKLSHLLMGLALVVSTAFYSCKPSDSQIQTTAKEALKAKPELAGITVIVDKGVATLSGEIADESVKNTAETTVKTVKGVKSVDDNITVKAPEVAPSTTVVMDSKLMESIKDAVKDFPGVSASVSDGVITLTGTIKKSKLPILMQALNALSPKSITNQLTVK